MDSTISSTEILPYPGDHQILQRLSNSRNPWSCSVAEPGRTSVVLGRGGSIEREIKLDELISRNIPLYRRQGGGGTVILGSGMLVITVAAYVKNPYGNKRYFRLIQNPIQAAIESFGVNGVQQSGISDLSWKEKKILGSSLRRKGALLLYQAVLLVHADRSLFQTLLHHPPREPDYRKFRKHLDFTINLLDTGISGTTDSIRNRILEELLREIPLALEDDLVMKECVEEVLRFD